MFFLGTGTIKPSTYLPAMVMGVPLPFTRSISPAFVRRVHTVLMSIRCPSGRLGAVLLLERRELRLKCALERRPCLATGLVAGEVRMLGDEIGVAQDAQHRRHHQVARREAVFEIVALAEPGGLRAEPVPHLLFGARPADFCPLGLGVEQVDADE